MFVFDSCSEGGCCTPSRATPSGWWMVASWISHDPAMICWWHRQMWYLGFGNQQVGLFGSVLRKTLKMGGVLMGEMETFLVKSGWRWMYWELVTWFLMPCNKVSAVLDYQDSKEGGQIFESTTIYADIMYIYIYRSVYTCICGIPLDIEMKL